MSTIVNLVQGSPDWLEYRRQMRNASETAAVLGLSPWLSPYQLWLQKTGRQEAKASAAMRHGTQLEPAARAAYEERTGHVMQPLVMHEGLYSASLDGITLDGGLILEIKCPYKGQGSALWQEVAAGHVPAHYQVQVQHQLMVSGAAAAHLWVYDGREGLLQLIPRDETAWPAIREAWDAFQVFLDEDRPPPLGEVDTVVREDTAWSSAAETYKAAKCRADEAASTLDHARDALLALAAHPREQGSGVTVTRYWKAGAIDYRQVPEIQSVDLERYRNKGRLEVRITAGK